MPIQCMMFIISVSVDSSEPDQQPETKEGQKEGDQTRRRKGLHTSLFDSYLCYALIKTSIPLVHVY